MCARSLRGPTRRRPIQLTALRGFEAAGRLLSFTRAAVELKLTQSSISRQVEALERQVGKRLFVRKTRALELTAAGIELLRTVRQSLAVIDRSVEEIRGLTGTPRVALTTYASFASLWLVPRLAAFQRAHQPVEIRIDASDRPVDLEAEGIDLAVRRARPQSAPTHARRLLDEEMTPAIAPELLARSGVALTEPADLLRFTLLDMGDDVSVASGISWERWFEFAQVPPDLAAAPQGGKLLFTYVDQSVQAAIRGQGVVLARTPFLDDLIALGELVAPFNTLRKGTGYCYYLVENRERGDFAHVAAFRNWLLEEFARGPRRAS